MCEQPCWPTPPEADRLIEAGYARKLMLEFWGSIEALSPANPGFGGKERPSTADYTPLQLLGFMFTPGHAPTRQGCVFQTKAGLCSLHDKGLKPVEGRNSCCGESNARGALLRNAIVRTWDTETGRLIVKKWKQLVKFKPRSCP